MRHSRTLFGTRAIGSALSGFLLMALAALPAQAALITGSMGLTGAFTASGGTDLSDATTLDFGSVTATSGIGDIGTTVSFGDSGTANNPLIFNPSTGISNLLQIGGWQLDITSSSIVDQSTGVLNLTGTGSLTGNGFELTSADWTLSANSTGSSYSMTVTAVSAVPLPGAVWMMGAGLAFLARVARRKHG